MKDICHLFKKRNAKPITAPPLFRDFLCILFISVFSCIFVESLARLSILSAFHFIYDSPWTFLFNVLLFASTFSVAAISSRRLFSFLLTFIIWLILGISSCYVSSVRMTPLVFYDVILLINNLSITAAYLSSFLIFLIALLFIGLLIFLFILYRHSPKGQHKRFRTFRLSLAILCLTLSCAIPFSIHHQDFSNTIKSYREYGFAYSFIRSALDRGISKPDQYQTAIVDELIEDISEDHTSVSAYKNRPNFVFVQLESFIDPALIENVRCSENPVPNFSYLKENASSGYLQVPSIGGGTANVEFEVMTGMRLNDFGTGEYPYTSVLKEQSFESAASILKQLNYTAHAIHNHNAVFYDRHMVYPNLGFDTFTSLEYMEDYQTNDRGWCHDDVLSDYIIKAMDSTEGKDMVFTISVQAHGNYSSEPPPTPYAITSTGLEEHEDRKNEFEDYIHSLHQTDLFLGDLIQKLEDFSEPVVLVAYGDHLPALTFSEEELITENHLITEYVLWSNDQRFVHYDKDLTAYQLIAYTLDRCGINEGILFRFHQEFMNDPDYLTRLAMLEYDLLYAKDQDRIYQPSSASHMTMGLDDISVSSAILYGDLLIVRGDHFTKHSVVFSNGNELSTHYIDENMLIATFPLLSAAEAGDLISVGQVSSDGTILSQTDSIPCVTSE